MDATTNALPSVASLPRELEDQLAFRRDRVLIIVGAGLACATDSTGCASWRGLLQHGLKYCRERPSSLTPSSDSLIEQMIEEGTTQGYLQAASRIETALRDIHDGQYGKWLSDSIGALRPRTPRTLTAVLNLKTQFATTNYDNLLEDVSGLKPVVWNEPGAALRVLRGDESGILHLHGHYMSPNSVILTSSDYATICNNPAAQNALRSVFTLYTVVFIGCGRGTSDPNFDSLIRWSRTSLAACQHTHYHLCLESEVDAHLQEYRHTCVRPLPYGTSFDDLAPFLERVAERVTVRAKQATALESLIAAQDSYAHNKRLLGETDAPLERDALLRRFDLARELWNAGGRRVAAYDLYGAMIDHKGSLPPRDRITFCLEAAELLVQEEEFDMAMKLVQPLDTLFASLPSDEHTLTRRFRDLTRRCYAGEVELDKLFRTFADSRAGASPTEQERLNADCVELYFLSGDLMAAENELRAVR